MDVTQAYAAEIVKAERDPDGDLIVYGKATGPEVDLDAQICDPTWLGKAMPSWAEWGNLREMHQPIAAGVGMELEQQGDNWMLKSKVVDEGTAKKIEAGALKGYSVGIKNAKVVKDAAAPGGRIVGGDIIEVSYVDRPCNPTATLALAKSAGSGLEPVDADDDDQDEDDDEDGKGRKGKPREGDQEKTVTLDGTVWDVDELAKVVRSATAPRTDHARAIALVEKAVGPDGTIDETADIEGGQQAIALIAGLIKMEADEVAAGHLDETYDIELLVRAAQLLKCFVRKEQATAVPDDDIAYVALAAKLGFSASEALDLPAETKTVLLELAKRAPADDPAPAPADEPTDPPPAEPGTDPDTTKTTDPTSTAPAEPEAAGWVSRDEINDLVKGAVAEATKAAQERTDALAAELAKVKATPIPGGPVVTGPAHTQPGGQHPDLAKAADYERQANLVHDPQAAAGYRQLAAELRARHAE